MYYRYGPVISYSIKITNNKCFIVVTVGVVVMAVFKGNLKTNILQKIKVSFSFFFFFLEQ